MEDVNKRRRISFSLYKVECALQEINSREIRPHLPFSANWNKRDSVWKTGILCKSDVFTAVAVVKAKAPCCWKSCANGSNIVTQPFGKHGIKEMLGVVGSKVWPVPNFAQQLPTTRKQQETNARWMIQRCCVRVALGFGIIHSLLDFVLPDFVLFWICKHRRH